MLGVSLFSLAVLSSLISAPLKTSIYTVNYCLLPGSFMVFEVISLALIFKFSHGQAFKHTTCPPIYSTPNLWLLSFESLKQLILQQDVISSWSLMITTDYNGGAKIEHCHGNAITQVLDGVFGCIKYLCLLSEPFLTCEDYICKLILVYFLLCICFFSCNLFFIWQYVMLTKCDSQPSVGRRKRTSLTQIVSLLLIDGVRFVLWPLIQGQIMMLKSKSDFISRSDIFWI